MRKALLLTLATLFCFAAVCWGVFKTDQEDHWIDPTITAVPLSEGPLVLMREVGRAIDDLLNDLFGRRIPQVSQAFQSTQRGLQPAAHKVEIIYKSASNALFPDKKARKDKARYYGRLAQIDTDLAKKQDELAELQGQIQQLEDQKDKMERSINPMLGLFPRFGSGGVHLPGADGFGLLNIANNPGRGSAGFPVTDDGTPSGNPEPTQGGNGYPVGNPPGGGSNNGNGNVITGGNNGNNTGSSPPTGNNCRCP